LCALLFGDVGPDQEGGVAHGDGSVVGWQHQTQVSPGVVDAVGDTETFMLPIHVALREAADAGVEDVAVAQSAHIRVVGVVTTQLLDQDMAALFPQRG